ncbi:MAG: hypothetical protein IKZ96_03795 [Bacilli bacterium]|nr:hypothetical protein [Bacilli bacterium]
MLNSILQSLLLTLLIELFISLVLGIRGKDLLRITLINILTNVPLNILVSLLYTVIDNNIVFYVIVPVLEVLIVLIEGTYFKKLNKSIIGPYKLSLLLNGFSYSFCFVCLLLEKIIK